MAEARLPGSHLRTATLCFGVLVLLQFASGALLYAVKIGLHPADTLEYYAGSAAMQKVYPQQPDRFRRAKTLEGLIKFSVGHIASFALIAFLVGHLLRSLTPPDKRRTIEVLSVALFALSVLDIAGCYLVTFGAAWMRYVRMAFFALFVLNGFSAGALLVMRSLRPQVD